MRSLAQMVTKNYRIVSGVIFLLHFKQCLKFNDIIFYIVHKYGNHVEEFLVQSSEKPEIPTQKGSNKKGTILMRSTKVTVAKYTTLIL